MRVAMGVAVGLAILMALSQTAPAQISLSSAVDLAVRNDPKMKMAELDVDRAKAALIEARGAYVPSIGANGGVGESVGVPLDLPVIFSIGGHSLVFNFSQRDYIRAARSGLRAAQLALQEAHDGVAEDVALTYIRLDNAQRRESTMAEEYGLANRLLTIVQERLDAGQDNRMDLLQARRTVQQIHLAQLQTQDDAAIQSDHLARLVGLPGTPVTTVPDSIPALPSLDAFPRIQPDSFGIQSAFVNAISKQEQAFGDSRWRFRPQMTLGFNYSRISTAFTNYDLYYPGFNGSPVDNLYPGVPGGLSENALSVGVQIQMPIWDRQRAARSRESMDDARHAQFDAENRRNQFLEGRFNLEHSSEELSAQADLAETDRDMAQEQLKTVLIQLTASSSGTETRQLNPKDEQNARILVSARTIDLLKDQLALSEAQVSLMRQTSTLDAWLARAEVAPANVLTVPAVP